MPFNSCSQATELLAEIGMTKSSLVKRSDDFSNMPFRAMPYYIKENVSYPMNPELVKYKKVS